MDMVEKMMNAHEESLKTFAQEEAKRISSSMPEVDYTLNEGDGLVTQFSTNTDLAVTVRVTPTSEVFMLDFGTIYKYEETAYELAEKKALLAHLFFIAAQYLGGNYYEIHEILRGRVVATELHVTDGGEDIFKINGPVSFLNKLRRFRAHKVRVDA